jgi:murein DD-endopeptidase MepM/ murein hydrolase activator NlpD
MPRLKLRLLLVALVAATIATVATPALAAEEFRLVYFPHEDVDSSFSNDWGDARSEGRSHKGTDIMAEKHSAVVAVADGFVTKIDESPRSGYYVRITHRDGWQSWYMHLNNDTPGTDDGKGGPEGAYPADLEVDMFVSAGTVIGYVGDSGNAEGAGSHTHFELHNGRRAVNPYPFLADAYDRWTRVMDLADRLR